MAYEMEMVRALIDNDQARIEAIWRLNTPSSYIGDSHDESRDKLIAGLSRDYRRSHAGFYPCERWKIDFNTKTGEIPK